MRVWDQATDATKAVDRPPAATLLGRLPAAIEGVLRLHGVGNGDLAAERAAMENLRVAPTNNRRVVGVMNELAFLGEGLYRDGLIDLGELSLRASRVLLSPLYDRAGSPDRELAAVLGTSPPTNLVTLRGRRHLERHRPVPALAMPTR